MRALLEPRRLLPILTVSLPMILLQWRYSRDGLGGPLGAAMCVAFVLVAPGKGAASSLGFKAGRWVDVVTMQRTLNAGTDGAPTAAGMDWGAG